MADWPTHTSVSSPTRIAVRRRARSKAARISGLDARPKDILLKTGVPAGRTDATSSTTPPSLDGSSAVTTSGTPNQTHAWTSHRMRVTSDRDSAADSFSRNRACTSMTMTTESSTSSNRESGTLAGPSDLSGSRRRPASEPATVEGELEHRALRLDLCPEPVQADRPVEADTDDRVGPGDHDLLLAIGGPRCAGLEDHLRTHPGEVAWHLGKPSVIAEH